MVIRDVKYNPFAYAAHQQTRHAGPAVGAHDNHVHLLLFGQLDDLIHGVTAE